MANRVSDSEVKEIIDTTVTTTPFIDAANLIVTGKLADQGLGDALLKEIERWMSAHLVAIRDPMIKKEKAGEAEATYVTGKEGMGLDATPYGQQVKLLDTSGALTDLGRRSAEFLTIDLDLD